MQSSGTLCTLIAGQKCSVILGYDCDLVLSCRKLIFRYMAENPRCWVWFKRRRKIIWNMIVIVIAFKKIIDPLPPIIDHSEVRYLLLNLAFLSEKLMGFSSALIFRFSLLQYSSDSYSLCVMRIFLWDFCRICQVIESEGG